MTYDGGSNGNVIREPNDFILFCWLGRYHGLITAPETDDPSLTKAKLTEEERNSRAEPYKGPKRPKVY
jgi:hypothetical protein